jgi:hypothetical protein
LSEKSKGKYHFGGLAVNERMYEKKGLTERGSEEWMAFSWFSGGLY